MEDKYHEIPGTNGNYSICLNGQVLNNKTGKYLKQNSRGSYLGYSIFIYGKFKCVYTHRLIAIVFLENPENKLTVNHIDGNKLNNSISNLEWSSYQENVKHAWDNGRCKSNLIGNDIAKKILSQKCRVNGVEFNSFSDAALHFGVSKSLLSKAFKDQSCTKNFIVEKLKK